MSLTFSKSLKGLGSKKFICQNLVNCNLRQLDIALLMGVFSDSHSVTYFGFYVNFDKICNLLCQIFSFKVQFDLIAVDKSPIY